MAKKNTNNIRLTSLLAAVVMLFCVSCNGGNIDEQVTLKIGDDDNMDQVLFDYVKNNHFARVYKFQEQIFENSNYVWKDYWIIDDLSQEEFDEMKSFANFESYVDKVMGNYGGTRKYSWKHVK